ncbi:hypothetical protein SH1V18_41250 [Vallitalea longa]|uniref:Uncharacterized protein n=1 Tax=Vallitalea longa TaxID=2936439 RepID=A0A9W5YCQ2_9FIRM|nr:hypothetical protein [Vallitalea longa]GKX31645.1 hypothetical protein SH1V18_41250 [Vallitalea longa]
MKHRKVLSIIIVTFLLTGCTNPNNKEEQDVSSSVNSNENERSQEEIIKDLEAYITNLEKDNRELINQINNMTVDEDNKEDIKNEERTFREDEYQPIVGVKSYEGDCTLMMFPYSDSDVIGEKPSEVNIISTGINTLNEKWALVEDLGSVAWNRYGYIKIEGLSDEVEGKFDYDSFDVDMTIDDIKIGDMKEKVISQYGNDYAVIKDGNGYLISYDGLDITIDSRLSRVMGIRTTKEGYSTKDGFSVGDNAIEVCRYYESIYKYDYRECLCFDLGNMYMMQIQIDTEELNEKSMITRIDIGPDWMGIFN